MSAHHRAAAMARSCRVFCLETFGFQASGPWRALGHATVATTPFPHGIVKHPMHKVLR
ncbi:MAG TPA: hypothetical protein PKO45_09140 [Rubrivivax sp.]|nr:hypothetical protein [Rubrivivax sp.]